jgi:hypothetical protein
MAPISSRTVAAPPSYGARLAWSLTMLLSLVLLWAAGPGHAASPARDADALGRWITDKTQPDMDYTVKAGTAGRLIVEVPAKAVGRARGETVTLDPVGPGAFATPKGGAVSASFTVTGPRRAEFKMMLNRPGAFNITDQLLSRP